MGLEKPAFGGWFGLLALPCSQDELGGPTMFPRIGVMRALNRGHVREFKESGKKHRWGRRKLKRDQ